MNAKPGDHVGIPDVITACPLLLLLETWSGWPFYESQDGVSVFTAALSLEWLREERLFCPSSWVFCSVGQISHAAVAVLASALSCSEYFLICSEGSTALISSVVLLLGILNHSMSHQLLFAKKYYSINPKHRHVLAMSVFTVSQHLLLNNFTKFKALVQIQNENFLIIYSPPCFPTCSCLPLFSCKEIKVSEENIPGCFSI